MGINESMRANARRLYERLHRARYHYQKVFGSPSGEYVMQDLAKFVHFNEDLFRDDQRVQDYLLGQRRVILRIIQMIGMTEEQIHALTANKDIDQE